MVIDVLAFRSYAAIDNWSLRARVMEYVWEGEVDKAALLCARTPGPVSAVLLAGPQSYASAKDRIAAGDTGAADRDRQRGNG